MGETKGQDQGDAQAPAKAKGATGSAKRKAMLAAMRKHLPTSGICLGITAVFLTLMHLLDTGRIGPLREAIMTTERKLLDFRFLQRGPVKTSGKIGVLAMDEKAIQRFGRFPFPRRVYEPVFRNLKELGVNWIGFDVVWSEPERPLLEDAADIISRATAGSLSAADTEALAALRAASPGDAGVARAVSDFGNIILGWFHSASAADAAALGANPFTTLDAMRSSQIEMLIIPEGRELKDYPLLRSVAATGNTPLISSAGSHFAFFNNEPDDDAMIRWVSLVREVDGSLMPSLALKTAAEMLGRQIVVFFDRFGIEEIGLVNPDDESDFLKIPVDRIGLGRLLLNHYGPGMAFRHFSLADAHDGTFTEEEKSLLKGMTMLLGPTAIAINDQRPNPFDGALNGVENHAAALENIISGQFKKRPVGIGMTEMKVVAIVSLILSILLVATSAGFSALAAFVVIVGYWFFDKHFWFDRGVWSYLLLPYANIFSLFVGVTLFRYFTEEREKKKVRGAFAHYLSPDVISQVLENPDSLKLGGERKELTVFFSDMRNFTNISETLSPEKLCELMNDYFTPMTGIILRSQGVLDKYIGDAIMAFWGAPIEVPDHADRAVIASIQMLYALDPLREDLVKRGFQRIDIGCGLNTGPMSVGNMGSAERFCYTVMGDSVNLGSRLESLTKEYGIKIMISAATRSKLTRKDIPVRDLDDIRVKGKNEPVRVFEVFRPDLLRTPQEVNDLIGEFERGREHYRAQAWAKAKEHFMQCVKIRPDDGPSAIFLERISKRETMPFEEGWDGVYTFKTK